MLCDSERCWNLVFIFTRLSRSVVLLSKVVVDPQELQAVPKVFNCNA
jgi:hypothetical protein